MFPMFGSSKFQDLSYVYVLGFPDLHFQDCQFLLELEYYQIFTDFQMLLDILIFSFQNIGIIEYPVVAELYD